MIMNVISQRGELINWYQRRGYQHTGASIPFPADAQHRPPQNLHFNVLTKKIGP
jgi:hypothetical protein